jgi:hypothetical protein
MRLEGTRNSTSFQTAAASTASCCKENSFVEVGYLKKLTKE